MVLTAHLIVVHYPLGHGLVQHFLVPLLQSLGLGDPLVGRVTVENVVIAFAGWACPNVPLGKPTDTMNTVRTSAVMTIILPVRELMVRLL